LHPLDPDWPCTMSLPTLVPERQNTNLPMRRVLEQDKFPYRSTSQTVPLPNHPSDRNSGISRESQEEGLRCLYFCELPMRASSNGRLGGPVLDCHPLAPHWQQASAPTMSCPLGGHPDSSSTIPDATETLDSATYPRPSEPSSPRRQKRPSVKIEAARIAPVASTNNTQWSSSPANGPSVNDSPSNEKVDEDSEWDGFRSQCVEMLRTLLSTALCFMSPLFLLGEMNGGAWAWV